MISVDSAHRRMDATMRGILKRCPNNTGVVYAVACTDDVIDDPDDEKAGTVFMRGGYGCGPDIGSISAAVSVLVHNLLRDTAKREHKLSVTDAILSAITAAMSARDAAAVIPLFEDALSDLELTIADTEMKKNGLPAD